ncbi:MAG: hypothetical protein U0169_15940 [Polyangiaceae bacterium]
MNAVRSLESTPYVSNEGPEARPSTVVPKVRRRTRRDPFAHVWTTHILPRLEESKGRMEATTLLDELQIEVGALVERRHLRTLQRRIRAWRDAQRVLEPARRVERMREAFDRVGLSSVVRALDGVLAIEAEALLGLIEDGLDAEMPVTSKSA